MNIPVILYTCNNKTVY